MGRLFDLLKVESNLYNHAKKTEEKVKEIIRTGRESMLENHGFSHIERVMEYVERVYDCYFRQFMPLNAYEAYILFSAIYIHDVGFFLHDKEFMENFAEWKKIEISLEDEEKFYREMHPWLSAYWVLKNMFGNSKPPLVFEGETKLGYYVMLVIIGHGIDFWKYAEYQKQLYKTGVNIRIDYLSYLLCLGDSLDRDKRRAGDTADYKLKACSVQERVYYRYQEYVNSIVISKEKIIINMCIPKVAAEKKEIFNSFYLKKQVKWLKVLLDVGKVLFSDISFEVSLKLCIRVCSSQTELTEKEYDYIENYLI